MIRSLLDPTLFQQYDAMRRGESPMGQGFLNSDISTLAQPSTLPANPTPPPPQRQAPTPPPAAAGAAAGAAAPGSPSNAFRNALLAGAQAASQAPAYDSVGSSIVSALADGLRVGSQAFSATRDAEADRDAKLAALQAQKAAEAEKARLIASGIGAFQAGDKAPVNFPVPMDAGPMAAPGGFDVNIPGRDAVQEAVKASGVMAPDVLKALEPQMKARADALLKQQEIQAAKDSAKLLAAAKTNNPEDYKKFLAEEGLDPETPPSQVPNGGARWAAYQERDAARKTATARAGASNTSILLPGGNKFAESFGSGMGDQMVKEYTGAQQAVQSIGLVDEARSLLKQPNFVGPGQNWQTSGASIMSKFFGIDLGGESVVNTQLIKNQLNNLLLTRLGEMGTRPSDRDIIELKTAIGQITDDPRSLDNVLVKQRKVLERLANQANATYDQTAAASAAGKIVMPTNYNRLVVPADPNASEGERRWNPETKKWYVSDGKGGAKEARDQSPGPGRR